MLASMEQSVIKDIEDNDFDYWDQIPPFGVVELYGIGLEAGKGATEAEIRAFFTLIYNFLLEHFMMFAFRESEIQSVCSYVIDWSNYIKTFFELTGRHRSRSFLCKAQKLTLYRNPPSK
ncbi:hypothetical protein [Paenibacillus sp. 2TAB19]|uniref:hypothetical protein n=1 Tax=Paenibacillus sp. 2TAB19 TaxID=3233003 RepID=UPI003F9E5032